MQKYGRDALDDDSKLLGPFCETVVAELDQRFSQLLDDDLYLVAAVMHSMYKLRWCSWTPQPELTEMKVRATCVRLMSQFDILVGSTKISKTATSSSTSCLFDLDDESASEEFAAESAETEFARYLDHRDRAKDILGFYRSKPRDPRLFQLVPQILCAPGRTAAVERVFSMAGHILNPKRMSLTDANFENQLFANLNRGVLQVRSNKLKL